MDSNAYYSLTFLSPTSFLACNYYDDSVDLFTTSSGRFDAPFEWVEVIGPQDVMVMAEERLVVVSSAADRDGVTTSSEDVYGVFSIAHVYFFDTGGMGMKEEDAVAILEFGDANGAGDDYIPEYLARTSRKNELLISGQHNYGHLDDWNDDSWPHPFLWDDDEYATGHGSFFKFGVVFRRCVPLTGCNSNRRDKTLYVGQEYIWDIGTDAAAGRLFLITGEPKEVLSCPLSDEDDPPELGDGDCRVLIRPTGMGTPTSLYVEGGVLYVGTIDFFVHKFDTSDQGYIGVLNDGTGDATSAIISLAGKPGVWPHGAQLEKNPVGNTKVAGEAKYLELELNDASGIPISADYGVEDAKRELSAFECRAEGEGKQQSPHVRERAQSAAHTPPTLLL